MKTGNLILLSLTLAAIFAAVSVPATAETPGHHPRYIRARSDLRAAQWLLRVPDEPDVMHHVREADESIERAVREIDRAAYLDRKDMDDHPRIDTHLDRGGRFRRAYELLQAARRDIGREEDNPAAIGWRDVAYRHVDFALDQLRRAARDLRIDRLEGR